MEPDELIERLAERLRRSPGEPAATMIVEEIWLAVVDGSLSSGERLPTARKVSIALGVSPRWVERAYRELEERGVVATRAGEGSFVSLDPPSEADRERHRRFADLCRDAVQRAAELGFGLEELLEALAEYRTASHPPATPEKPS